MPIGEYFKGSGSKVMSSMKKKYGDRAEEVFYATANKSGMKSGGKKKGKGRNKISAGDQARALRKGGR